ncbi:hypothetical protein QYE76_016112 [Lolium multiflorum]|uniref:Uncharacterized protein n=1 Tax=Lolium multiflorum TaxID=4521 RepID=A0AAD8U3N4_LOLMU|nr:hypothetical protein QYE76_016112 [Lolium multiflorum]
MENYSLLMGAAAVMKMAVEMAAVSMEKPSGGTSPSGRVPEQRLLSPRSWLRDGGGSGRRSPAEFFSTTTTTPSCCWDSEGIYYTSAARWNGERKELHRHRTRDEYGIAAPG